MIEQSFLKLAKHLNFKCGCKQNSEFHDPHLPINGEYMVIVKNGSGDVENFFKYNDDIIKTRYNVNMCYDKLE